MNYLLILVTAICCLLLISFVVTKFSRIPRHWEKQDMILRYAEGHGLTNEFMHYDFYNDSLHVYRRSMQGARIAEVKLRVRLEVEELNGLLDMLRQNYADKLKMRKTGEVLNDGTSFSLQLVHRNTFVINLSNGAYTELQASDKTRLNRIANHIHRLASCLLQKSDLKNS